MALKTTVTDIAEVPDTLRDHYKQTKDGSFALVLDGEPAGYVKADKLAEFRTNNRTLNSKVSELEDRLKLFDGLDPAAARAALAELAETEIVDDDADEQAKTAAIAEATNQQNKRVEELESQLADEKTAHQQTTFRNIVSVEFLKSGGRESAVDFMVATAEKTFAMKDGKITTTEFSKERPGEPLTVAEWMNQQSHVSDFAFRPSSGGGATGSTGHAPRRRTISAADPLEFGRNLEDIVAGKVDVE